ncbi:MAG: hypothetical protein LC117_10995 [Bacteroidia bacterium]|nr:hypothetical protein [Bacteroidia bacterium]MCZ2278442.1 hypothetical protein [Bacteroidia bacterium]
MKKFLILTYDYELFLGRRSGSVEQCEITPTNTTLKILSAFGAKAIFFTDTLQLVKLKQLAGRGNKKAASDFSKLQEQFSDLILSGHYIFPHIHTHWLDAVYINDSHEWDLSNVDRYRFSQCSTKQQNMVFKDSVEILSEMIRPVNPDYSIDTFRAGGWCIQPFSNFIHLFKEYGIKFEMSVLPGFYSFSNAQYFDFTTAPRQSIYCFEDDECRETPEGSFRQFTISSVPFSSFQQFLDRLWLKFSPYLIRNNFPAQGNGQASKPIIPQPKPKCFGYDVLENKRQRIAIELLTPVTMPVYKRFLAVNNYMHFLSHPKMITPYHHQLFKKFLEYAFSDFEIETDFKACLNEHELNI